MKDKQAIGIIGMPAFKRELFTRVILVAAIRPTCFSKAPEPARLPDILPPADLLDLVRPIPLPMSRRERRIAARLHK